MAPITHEVKDPRSVKKRRSERPSTTPIEQARECESERLESDAASSTADLLRQVQELKDREIAMSLRLAALMTSNETLAAENADLRAKLAAAEVARFNTIQHTHAGSACAAVLSTPFLNENTPEKKKPVLISKARLMRAKSKERARKSREARALTRSSPQK